MDQNEFGSGQGRNFSNSENSDRSNYGRRDGGYDNRPNYDGERRPRFNRYNDNSEQRPRFYRPNGEQRPRYNRYESDGEQRPRYTPRPNYGEQRPRYTPRPDGEQRPRYTPRPDGEQRPHYTPRPNYDRQQYADGEQRPRYTPRPQYGDGEQRPRYNNNRQQYTDGEQRPRFGNNRPQSGRPQKPANRPQKPVAKPQAKKKGKGKKSPEKEIAKKIAFSNSWFTNTENEGENFVVANSTTNPSTKMRLNRFIAMAGVCSRREADNLIAAGDIKVNGQVVTEMGVVVKVGDVVEYKDRVLKAEKLFYILLNKPKDTVTTTEDPEGRRTVMDLVSEACEERIYPVGRLDRNTTGVLLLTNDGELTEHLIHPRYGVRKIYHVTLDKNITEMDMALMLQGVELEDGEIHVDDVRYVDAEDRKQVGVQIHSGRNRIVRRIFEHLGYDVVKLDRVYFAGLTKVNVPRGKWRFLEEQEINKLKAGFFK